MYNIFDVCIHQNACFQFYPAFCNVSYMYFTYKLSMIISRGIYINLFNVPLFSYFEPTNTVVWASSMALSFCLRIFSNIPLKHTPRPRITQQFMVWELLSFRVGARGYLGSRGMAWGESILRHWGLDLIKSHSYPSSSSLFDPPDLVDDGDNEEAAAKTPWDPGAEQGLDSAVKRTCAKLQRKQGKRARSANYPYQTIRSVKFHG